MQIVHEKGYLIPAVNEVYESCAEQLANSIAKLHPHAKITIMTKDQLPFGDLGGFANDWQCFWFSPYRQTIKLEADMIAATSIDHWWNLFELKDVVISQGARTYRDELSDNRSYRKVFDNNNLPDVYNAITYWRRSETAQEFFTLIREIFTHWDSYSRLLKFPDETPSTDLVYAMAAIIMGVERVTLPQNLGPTIVHMKRHINDLQTENWTKELIWEKDPLRINTIAQQGLVHYHIKEWRLQ